MKNRDFSEIVNEARKDDKESLKNLLKVIVEELSSARFNNGDVQNFLINAMLEGGKKSYNDASLLKNILSPAVLNSLAREKKERQIAFYICSLVIFSQFKGDKVLYVTDAKAEAAKVYGISLPVAKRIYEMYGHEFTYGRKIGSKAYRLQIRDREIAYNVFARVKIPHLNGLRKLSLSDAYKVVAQDFKISVKDVGYAYKTYPPDFLKEFSPFLQNRLRKESTK